MPKNMRVAKSRIRGPETANHKAERDARVEEIMARVKYHQHDAERLMAEAKRKLEPDCGKSR